MKGTQELEKFARVSLVEHFVNLRRPEHLSEIKSYIALILVCL
jgi:hypothetical protein